MSTASPLWHFLVVSIHGINVGGWFTKDKGLVKPKEFVLDRKASMNAYVKFRVGNIGKIHFWGDC